MGVFVAIVWLAGVAVGLAASAGLIVATVILVRRMARSRRGAGLVAALAAAGGAAAGIVGMRHLPWLPMESGGDFGPVFRNAFAHGLGYCSIPGLAACVALAAVALCPRRRRTCAGTDASSPDRRPA